MRHAWILIIFLAASVQATMYLPDRCLTPVGITCESDTMSLLIDDAAVFKVNLMNGAESHALVISNMSVTIDPPVSDVSVACLSEFDSCEYNLLNASPDEGYVLKGGESQRLIMILADVKDWQLGLKYKFKITYDWRYEGSDFWKTSTMEARVTAKNMAIVKKERSDNIVKTVTIWVLSILLLAALISGLIVAIQNFRQTSDVLGNALPFEIASVYLHIGIPMIVFEKNSFYWIYVAAAAVMVLLSFIFARQRMHIGIAISVLSIILFIWKMPGHTMFILITTALFIIVNLAIIGWLDKFKIKARMQIIAISVMLFMAGIFLAYFGYLNPCC